MRRKRFQNSRIRRQFFDSDDYFFTEEDKLFNFPPVVQQTGSSSSSSTDDQKKNINLESKFDEPDLASEGGKSKLADFYDRLSENSPKAWFKRALWLWERPVMKLGRLTVFFAQIPSALAVIAPQIGALASKITLPMLPPLLVGAGILLRSVWVNAGYLFPRLYLTCFVLWGIWLLNSMICRTVIYFTKQGTVSNRGAHAIMNWVEGLTLVTAGLVTLSLFGVNISGLLLPAGICLALAAKDLSHNFLAGIVLFLAQPFRVGDEVSVQSNKSSSMPHQASSMWFEGVCEKVDLRYTVLKKGKYRLYVPNASFVTKEFLVVDNTHEEMETMESNSSLESAMKDTEEETKSLNDDHSIEGFPYSYNSKFPEEPLRLGDLGTVLRNDQSFPG